MHPAYSVIFFTVASGTGYGLLILLALLWLAGALPADLWFGLVAMALALGMIGAGLLSSTFHLGRPERAWRAFSQWRSSWLSREGVLAVMSFPAALAMGYGRLLADGGWWPAAAAATLLLSLATVFATSMIYRSLKPIRQWDNPWVVVNYLALSLFGGALWLNGLGSLFGLAGARWSWLALALLLVGAAAKLAYWRSIDRGASVSTPESATGLGAIGRVRPLDPPHTEENYVQQEMGYRIARKHAARLRLTAVLGAFALPVALVIIGLVTPGRLAAAPALLAAIFATGGLLVERWLFFAEAKHTVTLYYGAERV